MTIEAQLERIANALESLAGSRPVEATDTAAPEADTSSSKKPAKSQKTSGKTSKAKASADDTEYTKDDVKDALLQLQNATDAATARALLKDVGNAKTLGALKKDMYATVIEAAKERAGE